MKRTNQDGSELQRLQELFAEDIEFFQQTKWAEALEMHVSKIAHGIKDELKEALAEDTSKYITQDFINDAKELLERWLSISLNERESISALENLKPELFSQVKKKMIEDDEGSALEIAHQLARALLTNWIATMDHAISDEEGGFIIMGRSLIRNTEELKSITESINCYSLDGVRLYEILKEYIGTILAPGEILAIAPQVHIFWDGEKYYGASSNDIADKIRQIAQGRTTNSCGIAWEKYENEKFVSSLEKVSARRMYFNQMLNYEGVIRAVTIDDWSKVDPVASNIMMGVSESTWLSVFEASPRQIYRALLDEKRKIYIDKLDLANPLCMQNQANRVNLNGFNSGNFEYRSIRPSYSSMNDDSQFFYDVEVRGEPVVNRRLKT